MVGGGPGAFIGPVHRIAAELDGRIALVAGAFSSDPDRSRAAGVGYGIDPARAYPDIETMITCEARREDGIDLLCVATPNHLHLHASRLALEAGLAVMSDKPATATLAQAQELAAVVGRTGRAYALSFTYSGYPLVREARARVAAGELGAIRRIVVEYSQGWLSSPLELSGNKQAAWRTDPAKAGLGGCISDIGVHAFHLAEFVTGLPTAEICADLGHVVPGRALDDDCNVLLRFEGGARGLLTASQIATGERNNLRLRVYGEHAGLDWSQEQPDRLTINQADGRSEIIWGGSPAMGADARAASRTPAGHPEGYLEAFATLYRDFTDLIEGKPAPLLPGISEGVRSLAFVTTAVEASAARAGWTPLQTGTAA